MALAGGKCVFVDTYPDFQIDVNRVREAITPRTQVILFNSPANPTGVVAGKQQIRDLAQLAAERDVLLVSDEIYREFCYEPFVSPAEFNARTLVIDGFSKTYGMTGWRLGFAHGPAEIIEEMTQAAAVHVRLRADALPVRRRGGARRRHERLRRRLPPQAGPDRGGAGRRRTRS